ncbi:aryl-sulfate sulfotransferase [bacterium]|nr:aryl-sulfate sulfotransferase [bacterium]
MKKLPLLFFVIFTIYHTNSYPESRFDPYSGFHSSGTPLATNTGHFVRTINGVSIPSDFPDIEINQNGETAPGKIFFASTFGLLGNYIVILNNDGTPYFYRKYPESFGFYNASSGDFKLQQNDVLSAYIYRNRHQIVLDHNYVEIDTFQCIGHSTDSHECLILPNGHAVLIANETLIMDLSHLGGSSNATIQGSFIQEQDNNHGVVWEWHPYEQNRYQITDAIHEDLTQSYILAPTINSIAVDYDGQIIISARALDEVTKINHETGEIIWRLGGRNNDFTWIHEDVQFTHQHHARPVHGMPNHYTIYDNGNYRTPDDTRAVEYKLDPVKKTAEKVWEFWIPYTTEKNRHMMGSVQRLSNGNTYIDWSEWPPLQACEVNMNGQIVFELTVNGASSYRSKRFEWEGMALVPYLIAESYHTGVALIFNKFGDLDVDHYHIYGATHPNPTSLMTTSHETYIVLSDLQNNADYYFRVKAVDTKGHESDFSNEVQVLTSFGQSGENMVKNGDFSDNTNHWELMGSNSTGEIDEQGQYHLHVTTGGTAIHHVKLLQENIKLLKGSSYLFEFDAYAGRNRLIDGKVEGKTNYAQIGYQGLKKIKQHFAYEFIMKKTTDLEARIVFDCGGEADSDIYFDNISLKEIIQSSAEKQEPMPADFTSYQNYPNPFNGSTVIRFHLSQTQFVTLKIYDLLGKEIKRIISHRLSEGEHKVKFEAENLPSGIYLFQLKVGNPSSASVQQGSKQKFSKTRKMIIQK